MNKDVTILIPTYNREDVICETLASCYNQSEIDRIKILVYDDGSTDNTVKKIEENYPLVNIIKGEKNNGVGFARNQLLQKLDTDFAAWLDSDDIMCNKRVEKCLEYFANAKNKEKDIVYSYIEIFPSKKIIKLDTSKYNKNDFNTIKHNTTCATAFFKNKLKNFKFENLKYGSEDVLWIWKLLNNNIQFGHIDECLYFYRKHNESITAIKKLNSDDKNIEDKIIIEKIKEYTNIQ
jgi:glycosyltransferase involved in cell wall biosynthesis